jgi:hypothetical protein
MMRRLTAVLGAVGIVGALCCSALAQGTKLWTQSRYDEMERGTTDGVAIRNDGRLEVAPASSLLHATSGNYVWSIAADGAGNAYLGRGGTSAGSAIVTRVTPDGKATDIFAGKELAVQALRSVDGALYAATSPDGKVYRIPGGAKAGDSGAATVVFDPATTTEKPKYIWDLAAGKDGALYVATGAPAAVYKVPVAGGKPQLLFKTVDQHIRGLLLQPDGTLYAGSDGSGVIYRISTTAAGAKPFAVYAAPRREITALAMDAAGNIYAAGVGEKGESRLPNLPVTGATGVTITFAQPGSSNAASTNTVVPEGSEIYRIAADGTPARLLSLKDDVIYALAERKGSLLAATGNRGRIYRVDTAVAGQWTDVAHLEAAQGMAFAPVKDGLLVASSNSGKVFRLEDAAAATSTYTSAVFDAQVFSQWGRAEVLPASLPTDAYGSGGVDLYVRSGNVESPLMGWSEWSKATPNHGAAGVPNGRFVQWKAVLRGDASVASVGLDYLPRNIAPVVDEVMVQAGARVVNAPPQPNTMVQVNFPAPSSNSASIVVQQEPPTAPLPAQRDKTAVTVRWAAHDDNGDNLMFAVYWKGEGERNWQLLKDKIGDRFLSFDAGLLPDGRYTIKVVASDAPVHTDADTLTGERVSSEFVVDTTPPVPGVLSAQMEGGKIHATFDAKDATSPIAHAEYSVDAGPWQYLEPADHISDSLSEHYDFLAEIPTAATPVASANDPKEHVIAVRVYDRYDNAVTAKAIVR